MTEREKDELSAAAVLIGTVVAVFSAAILTFMYFDRVRDDDHDESMARLGYSQTVQTCGDRTFTVWVKIEQETEETK